MRPVGRVGSRRLITMWCPKCGAEYRQGFDRCSSCDVDLVAERDEPAKRSWRSWSPWLVALTTVTLVAAVVAWHALPSPSELRLSLAGAGRACNAFATRHGGQAEATGGESVANAKKLDRAFRVGAGSFLATVPRSQGLAYCTVTGTDIEACPGDSGGVPSAAQILVTADGSAYVRWCPLLPGGP
jgi:hypothetical protein